MPPAIQKLTFFIPRYYPNIIRGIFLNGSGFSARWPDALTQRAIGIAAVTLASLRIPNRLDLWCRSRHNFNSTLFWRIEE